MTKYNTISSLDNSNIKLLRKLKMKKFREYEKKYIIEGLKLIQEAKKNNINIESVFFSSRLKESSQIKEILFKIGQSVRIFEVDDNIFIKIASTESTQGIMAIVSFDENFYKDIKQDNLSNFLILDRIQDPGNMGTIIRTADAAGFDLVICSKGCVDIYNEKTIRSTMGSLFHIPIVRNIDLEYVIEDIKKNNFQVFGAFLKAVNYYTDVSITKKNALVIGNESNGIDSRLIDICDKLIKIPLHGKAESLNASVAAGILMYHFANSS